MSEPKPTVPSVPDTAFAKQPKLTDYTLSLLGELKPSGYIALLYDAVTSEDCKISKENFDNIIYSLGELTVKPVPPEIIELLFGILHGNIRPDPDIDEHSYSLVISSLKKLIDPSQETRLIRGIAGHLGESQKFDDDITCIVSDLYDLIHNLK